MHDRVVRGLLGLGVGVAAVILIAVGVSSNSATVTASTGSCASLLDNGGPPSEWVYWDANGRLAYKNLDTLYDYFGNTYAGSGDRIMDFSYAGYMGGGVALPNVPARATLSPIDSADDDTPRIQAAIDQVGAMPADTSGIRGAVELQAGTYRLFGVLNLKAGGVVLRGAGSGPSGTVFDLGPTTHEAFNVDGTGSWSIGASVAITDAYVPYGTRTIRVADASPFQPGQRVLVTRTASASWIQFMSMHDLMRNGLPQTWLGVGSKIRTDRTVVAVSGDTLTLDVPLSDSFDSTYLSPTGEVAPYTFPTRISQVGIEHVRVIGRSDPQGNKLLSMDAVTDSWVKDVFGQDLRSGLSVGDTAKRITLDSITLNHTYPDLNAAAPGDFGISGTQTLLVRCKSLNASGWFYALTQSTDTGPIVVLDFEGSGGTAIQPHQRWATGMLTDRAVLHRGAVEYIDRGHMGSGHGWTMGWGVAWNNAARTNVQRPPGSMNWAIGNVGSIGTSTEPGSGQVLPHGIYESQGTHVSPSSLYLAQLCDRLGPQALANIGYSNPLPPPTATPIPPTPTPPPTATPTPQPLPPGITEITPGPEAVTASTHDGNVPGNTVDGRLDTRWSAQFDGQWIQYDLGASHVVAFLKVAAYSGNSRRQRFDIQVSMDGASWSTVWVGESSGTTLALEHYEIADVLARYVRLLGHENSANNWNSFTEVEIFASSGTPEPPTPTPRVTPRPTPPPDPLCGANLALNKPSTASTNWSSSFNAPKAFDGSNSSRWSATLNSVIDQWLRVDLGASVHLNCAKIVTETRFKRVTSYVLQVSDDGANFTDIAETEGDALAAPLATLQFPTVQARYVRLLMRTSSKEPTINELSIHYQQRPPEITVPPDMIVEATGPEGAVATFEVSAIDDKDGPVSATAEPPSGSLFPLGPTTVTVTARDSDENTATKTFEVTIVDTTPPVMTAPADIVAEATSGAGAIVHYTATADDVVSGNVPVVADFPSGSTFPLGRTVVTLRATDEADNTAKATFLVDVVDTTAPVFEAIAASPDSLWPPNHKMHTVTLAVQVSEAVDAAPVTRIVKVVSSGPDDGPGDGQTQGDWRITGDLSLELRAERPGRSAGRIYTITVESRDASNNAATATVTVTAPHDQGH